MTQMKLLTAVHTAFVNTTSCMLRTELFVYVSNVSLLSVPTFASRHKP